MRKVYLLNDGDTYEKVLKIYPKAKKNVNINEQIDGKEFVILEDDGVENIDIVENSNELICYEIEEGDTVEGIIKMGFEIVEPYDFVVGQEIILYKPTNIRHIVSPLETLTVIANKYGVTKQDLINTNKLKTEKLFVGQILWI